MADTLESIFQATSLGGTELNDGEHTILTTNSTTSFVIKDMYVNNTSSLTNTHLELNGFNVSGITSNATGSLIIPPSSTLKLKTTDYPFTFVENMTWVNNSNDGMFRLDYQDTAGNVTGTAIENYGSAHLSDHGNITDAMYYTSNVGGAETYIVYTTNDTNSQQRAYSWRLSDDYVLSIRNESYKPFGVYQDYLYYMENATFKELNLTTSPTGPSFSNFTNSSQYNSGSNSYSPFTQSSYPRARASHGFYWYIVNSSYNNSIYGIKLEGSNKGAWIKFTFPNNQSLSSARNFCFSPDEATNTLYCYRMDNSSTVYKHVFNNWTTIQGTNQSSLKDYLPDTNEQLSLATSIKNNNMASNVFQPLLNGGFSYHSSNHELIEINKAGQVANTTAAGDLTFDGNTFSSPNNGLWKKQTRLSDSQATALSLSAPTFGLQLLGVRSTV